LRVHVAEGSIRAVEHPLYFAYLTQPKASLWSVHIHRIPVSHARPAEPEREVDNDGIRKL